MDMAMLVAMRSIAVDMSMCEFMTVFVYMSMLMKMLVCMSMTVLVII